MKSSTSVDVAGQPVTTNVAIFWVAGTRPGAAPGDSARGTPGLVARARPDADRKGHWEQIFRSKAPEEVSWFQEHAQQSLKMIESTGVNPDAPIIDVGGGTSPLVADLLDRNFTHITVLDLSGAALRRAQARLGAQAARVEWIEADITEVAVPPAHYEIWHDRAVFHFLTDARDRRRYVRTAAAALKPRGHVIVATFAADGPTECSGLSTARYSPEALQDEFDAAFALVDSAREVHATPFGTQQQFIYCHFQKRG